MMSLSSGILKKIENYAVHVDWDLAFDGKSKGNMHLFRVNQLAKYLCNIEGGEMDIVIAGAWLHDVGLAEGNRGHCFKGAKIAKKFLGELDVDYKTIMQVIHCIEAHDGEVEARSIEAKIVHDADTVDKMGPLGLIRHAWKLSNVDYYRYTVPELLEYLPKHLRERRDHLYLTPAVAVADSYALVVEEFFGDEKFAKKVLYEVMKFAKDGVPTETTIDRLRMKGWMREDFVRVLDEQLTLSFL
jgi:uncharacterized protein